MKKHVAFLLITIPFTLMSMDMPFDDVIKALKVQAKSHLLRNTDGLVKISAYHKAEQPLNREKAIQEELDKGQYFISPEKRVVCAHNLVMFFDAQNQLYHSLPIPVKVDSELVAIKAICLARLAGSSGDKILLGQEDGAILIGSAEKEHSPEKMKIKTLGQVKGPILSFAVHPNGTQIAVRFASKEERYIDIPCLGLSCTYVPDKQVNPLEISQPKVGSYISVDGTKKVRRRSFIPEGTLDWTPFLSKPCEHAVKNSIRFDNNHCITECETGNIEAWHIINPATNPELVGRVIKHAEQTP